jgi:hypothetical protein
MKVMGVMKAAATRVMSATIVITTRAAARSVAAGVTGA